MISAYISIKLKSGEVIAYANKYIKEKEIDGKKVPGGIPCASYFYSDKEGDKYEDQNELGKIKADYEYISEQLNQDGDEYILWPEADEEHGDVAELVRHNSNQPTGYKSSIRTKIRTGQVAIIQVIEKEIRDIEHPVKHSSVMEKFLNNVNEIPHVEKMNDFYYSHPQSKKEVYEDIIEDEDEDDDEIIPDPIPDPIPDEEDTTEVTETDVPEITEDDLTDNE